MEELVRVENLTWCVDRAKIIDIASFSLSVQEKIALIGENGSGKSSFVKLLALLECPTSGRIYYRGREPSVNSLETRRKIAVVFQEPLLLKGTVWENVALGLKLRRYPADIVTAKVEYWLGMFGIEHLKKRNVRNLSGGESQRVSLARAMVNEPELLILDEPFSALDAPTRAGIVQDFCEIVKNSSLTTVFITHNMTEIPLLADRVCVMEKGEIVEEGVPNKILNYPEKEVTAGLVGIENILEGQVRAAAEDAVTVDCGAGWARLSAVNRNRFSVGDQVKVLIKPNMIRLGEKKENNSFKYTVEKVYPLPNAYKLMGNCGFALNITVERDAFITNKLGKGQEVNVFIPPESIHLIKTGAV